MSSSSSMCAPISSIPANSSSSPLWYSSTSSLSSAGSMPTSSPASTNAPFSVSVTSDSTSSSRTTSVASSSATTAAAAAAAGAAALSSSLALALSLASSLSLSLSLSSAAFFIARSCTALASLPESAAFAAAYDPGTNPPRFLAPRPSWTPLASSIARAFSASSRSPARPGLVRVAWEETASSLSAFLYRIQPGVSSATVRVPGHRSARRSISLNSSTSCGVLASFSFRVLSDMDAQDRAPAVACSCMSFSRVSLRSAWEVCWSNRPALMTSSAISIFCCCTTLRTTLSILSVNLRVPPVPHVVSSGEHTAPCPPLPAPPWPDPPMPPSSSAAPISSMTASM
mmetsp:Transcript_9800/g.39706  ORF Transcript_9800/g.39706 Transcript_9800/m.39706 type:complete len:342 (-) Transcript_9800:3018-4043(-)